VIFLRSVCVSVLVTVFLQATEVPPISEQSLKGHLSFIASDLLEGRDTPSRGLDLAAEYIAAQFRRAGLEPGGTDGYFQTHQTSKGKERNVIGILRGTDPKLKDTYVFLTAHYDHLGVKPDCTSGDCIFNGANDDGSGTVSVIEIASTLGAMTTRPRRSIVFMTFFGEEKGLLGSEYYVQHPVVPLKSTVADINLEQLGRTDDPSGPQINSLLVTGYLYSGVGGVLHEAGVKTGINVHRGDEHDAFIRSDNLSFAEHGVPAHTVGVAFDFPDYHAVGDEWEKIDYANMARVDRMIATAVLTMANSATAPQWNNENPKAAPFAKHR
jgi:Zn-dependent M28 family amino/carboxypeptidase